VCENSGGDGVSDDLECLGFQVNTMEFSFTSVHLWACSATFYYVVAHSDIINDIQKYTRHRGTLACEFGGSQEMTKNLRF
jgi:hypothetical protein